MKIKNWYGRYISIIIIIVIIIIIIIIIITIIISQYKTLECCPQYE